MRALLDVNVLIALLDAGHIMHHTATRWLAEQAKHGWATCPLTQNGVIRIMSQPNYPAPKKPAQVAERLMQACADASHVFWPADQSLLDSQCLRWQHMLGHRQVTDSYLLALAVHHQGIFATFDQRIDPKVVVGATPQHWQVIGQPSM